MGRRGVPGCLLESLQPWGKAALQAMGVRRRRAKGTATPNDTRREGREGEGRGGVVGRGVGTAKSDERWETRGEGGKTEGGEMTRRKGSTEAPGGLTRASD
jgi:hypothetical protein